ncbi:hypothetical protein CDAR_87341 [Caerostris darwini]|uniref:Uncharacterized protein n=1 Tax=Caerostris darwini TaxID=1538125 RepID=A0AAV4U8A5_9ARAC|nr:hypothetical protein CDAR_87341 [Caerostris darwini]
MDPEDVWGCATSTFGKLVAQDISFLSSKYQQKKDNLRIFCFLELLTSSGMVGSLSRYCKFIARKDIFNHLLCKAVFFRMQAEFRSSASSRVYGPLEESIR